MWNRYTNHVFEPIPDEEHWYVFLQQGSGTGHGTKTSMDNLREVLGIVISSGL